ncbi:peroxiredoxin [Halanaerobium saccharolyticum]|uniref:Peroxiredoxin n=1 Tax=Halanaerobium saccharolyticum TaxID=43595 RepID=A0A4R7YZ79_9FIRM|nr:TlpA disulfide reductase family protein [Halanaerobium saccharolyticum]RAK12747.1 peroxiredoxin [Halanaerobium saccharolyticum]TDW02960.1 peroxiredoxin [Halanaerobium saccharolyticum]TDX62856.1 peroxiredoxin [Halanaerobium saccharolyticum]
MQKKISIFLIAALIVGGLSFFFLQSPGNAVVSAEVGTEIGMQAPDFTLKNMNDQEVNLSDYRGQKVFLNFWASWCPPCRKEMPDMQKLHEEYGKEVVILAVNVGENKSTAANFMMENGLNFSVLLDTDKSTAQNYLVRGIPTSYFLDKNGIIKEKVVGAVSYERMLELNRIEK